MSLFALGSLAHAGSPTRGAPFPALIPPSPPLFWFAHPALRVSAWTLSPWEATPGPHPAHPASSLAELLCSGLPVLPTGRAPLVGSAGRAETVPWFLPTATTVLAQSGFTTISREAQSIMITLCQEVNQRRTEPFPYFTSLQRNQSPQSLSVAIDCLKGGHFHVLPKLPKLDGPQTVLTLGGVSPLLPLNNCPFWIQEY